MSNQNDDIICPRCDSFIGKRGDLDTCPVCGYNLVGEDNKDE